MSLWSGNILLLQASLVWQRREVRTRLMGSRSEWRFLFQ
jgi:hypothetical protein